MSLAVLGSAALLAAAARNADAYLLGCDVLGAELSSPDVLDVMAAIEHQQWVYWASYMLDNATPENIERWRGLIETPFDELAEYDKDADREWAQRAIEAFPEVLKQARAGKYPKPKRWTPGQPNVVGGDEPAFHTKKAYWTSIAAGLTVAAILALGVELIGASK